MRTTAEANRRPLLERPKHDRAVLADKRVVDAVGLEAREVGEVAKIGIVVLIVVNSDSHVSINRVVNESANEVYLVERRAVFPSQNPRNGSTVPLESRLDDIVYVVGDEVKVALEPSACPLLVDILEVRLDCVVDFHFSPHKS